MARRREWCWITLYFRFNWSHAIASDTPDKGHLLKSRAKANYILYNRITGAAGTNSYEIELPHGGLAVVLGNVVHKSRSAGNSVLLSWGAEGAQNPDKRLFVVNNTFVNDLGKGTFIHAAGATLTAKNNLFVGAGTLASTGALSADNLSVAEPGFVDRNHFDYHLTAGSPALGKAVAAGTADQFSLSAVSQYAHPLGETSRGSVHDVGAYELVDGVGSVADAGSSARDAGASTRADAASPRGHAGVPPQGPSDAAVADAAVADAAVADAAAGGDHRASSGCSVGPHGRRENAFGLLWLLCGTLAWRLMYPGSAVAIVCRRLHAVSRALASEYGARTTRREGMPYIDGFIAAVPTKNKDAYRKHVQDSASLFKELGATRMVETWADDVPDGKVTDFKRAVLAKQDEAVVFSWIEYPDRATRDAAAEKMMSDPRMAEVGRTMPFDGHRMIYGGFAPLVDEGAGSGGYVDGFVVPVPDGKKDAYRALAAKTSVLFKEYGALRVVEAWGDDVPAGKTTDFYRATQATEGEKVVFSWIVWPDKATRDKAWQACMKDPRMRPEGEAPFDEKRMFWGGFTPIFDA